MPKVMSLAPLRTQSSVVAAYRKINLSAMARIKRRISNRVKVLKQGARVSGNFFRVGIFSLISLLSFSIAPPAHAGLYSFTSHTFTPCAITGPNGPTLADCQTAYSSASWAGNVNNFNVIGGKQYWTVPRTGTYRVTVAGAAGAVSNLYTGGLGVVQQSDLSLTEGNILILLPGQKGLFAVITGTGGSGGGGGGSFLVESATSTLLMASGGGGGAGKNSNGQNGSTTINATSGLWGSTGGTLSAGGTSVNTYNQYYGGGGGGANSGNGSGGHGSGGLGGAGGAGYKGNGGAGANNYINTAQSFSNGGVGSYHATGTLGSITQGAGGFGGGGNGSPYMAGSYNAGGGGGGGYTGGGGGNGTSGPPGTYPGTGGGGGGSYISGANQSASASNSSDGYIVIQNLTFPTVSMSIAGNVKEVSKGQRITLTATLDDTVKITFFADGKRIPGCIGMSAVAGTVTCSWKPTIQKSVIVYSVISQNGSEIARSTPILINSKRRTGTR